MEAVTPITKTTPSNKVKLASRLAQLTTNNVEFESESENNEIPHYQVEYAPSPSPQTHPKSALLSSTPSNLSNTKTRGCLPMRELLLNLSPSPVRKSKSRLSDRLDVVDDHSAEYRRKCKTRISANGLSGCGSPRVLRRARRRIENDERENVGMDELVKPRKRRISRKSKKEKGNMVNSGVSSKDNGGESAQECLKVLILDLLMWRDVAKSSLWFGFGCLSCLSSCFTKGLNFSLLSVISQLGLVFLAVSFISNTLLHRENVLYSRGLCLREDDIMRTVRLILPAVNLAISKTRELFSGEPSITLKVASFFMFGAEYGHLLTLWRLCVLGFLTSFTVPKLYSFYAAQIENKVDHYKSILLETWRGCYHKKIVVASAATIFWNLSSLKIRVLAAFISLIILRYYQQNASGKLEEATIPREENLNQQQNLEKVEEQVKETTVALVVVDKKSGK